MKFSVIIPVRTINDFIRENIARLKQQDYRDFEVIIITDDPEVYDFGDTRFSLISSGKVGPGEKRNLGAERATGDILAFLDDDAYPKSDWLTQAAILFSDPNVYALGGPAVTPLDAKFREECSGRILASYLTSAGTRYRHTPMPAKQIKDYPSVNLFVRKEAFDKAGGYIKDFWPGEDTKLCLDLVKLYGMPFLYDPRPVVYHHRRNIYLPHLKQISRYGKHRGQFARIYPETSRLPAYFMPSAFVLGLVLGPVIAAMLSCKILFYLYLAFLAVYFLLVAVESLRIFLTSKNLKMAFAAGLGIFLTHLVYGVNFIFGLLVRPKLKLRGVDTKSGNYLGG